MIGPAHTTPVRPARFQGPSGEATAYVPSVGSGDLPAVWRYWSFAIEARRVVLSWHPYFRNTGRDFRIIGVTGTPPWEARRDALAYWRGPSWFGTGYQYDAATNYWRLAFDPFLGADRFVTDSAQAAALAALRSAWVLWLGPWGPEGGRYYDLSQPLAIYVHPGYRRRDGRSDEQNLFLGTRTGPFPFEKFLIGSGAFTGQDALPDTITLSPFTP